MNLQPVTLKINSMFLWETTFVTSLRVDPIEKGDKMNLAELFSECVIAGPANVG